MEIIPPAGTPSVDPSDPQPLIAPVQSVIVTRSPDAPAVTEPAASVETFAAVSATEALMLALTPPQRTAIERMTHGETRVAAASAAGVSRATLNRWLSTDAAFQAAYNAWQKDVLDTARARLLSVTDVAVNTVLRAMKKGDARVALTILDRLGITTQPKPGPTDEEEVMQQQLIAQRKRELAQKKERSALRLDEMTTMEF